MVFLDATYARILISLQGASDIYRVTANPINNGLRGRFTIRSSVTVRKSSASLVTKPLVAAMSWQTQSERCDFSRV